ncbi:FUSC family protein [Paucibacter sp. R3-3]|uniref:FUSC family protein n=1 Tax=Roseateles agri TaxID=3098619 RepID=A0ABU5DC17_9BURK|nr:FUSC family protein [Paucibacter sp. R3-3]MDY0743818.1 FUSC family protein [Paucibacter sp. R3-3]
MQSSAANPIGGFEARLDRALSHLPSAREWLLSGKTFLAAMLAFYLALAAGLPRPYWAFAAVYVVSNPLTGATRSKGLYRVLGTLIGASVAVLVLPLLVDTPVLLSLFISVWTGTLLYLSFLDRLPSNYVYMLAAYTLPMIALPMVQAPDQVFTFAVARTEEILLGIVCASLVSALVLPGKAAPVLQARFRAWLDDAGIWATGLLRSEAHGQPRDARSLSSAHRLAADVLAMDQFISHLRHDTDSDDLVRIARELRMRLSLLLPTLSSVSDAVRALGAQPGGIAAGLAAQMDGIADWIAAPPSAATDAAGTELQQALRRRPADGPALPLLHRHVLMRLEGLVQLWRDCRALQRMMDEGRLDPAWVPAYERWTFSPSVRHHDHGMQLFSAVSVCTVTFLACLGWIFSGWADGAGAVIMCAVCCCFFAAQDEPAPSQLAFFWVNTACLVLGVLLLFVVMPSAHEFETLVLVLAPIFLVIGTLVTRPAFAITAMGLSVTLATGLGLSDAYNADFSAFVNSSVASIAGNLLALVWTLLTRPFGATLSLHRLLRASWADLARTAGGRHGSDIASLRARMIDRLSQLLPRLAASTGLQGTDGLAELRVGFSAVLLQRELPGLAPEAARRVQAVLDALELHYSRRLRLPVGQPLQAGTVLRGRIEAAIDGLAAGLPEGRDALQALVELRLTLANSANAASPNPGVVSP